MSNEVTEFTSPVGRWVTGSIWDAVTKDGKGNPLVYKSGPKVGQPREKFDMGIAFDKQNPEWSAFHQLLYQRAAQDFPMFFPGGQCNKPSFAFKIKDGDDQTPNGKGKRICDMTGAPGHWIVFFSNGFVPSAYKRNDQGVMEQITNRDMIKKGYYVRVAGTVAGNGDQDNSGLFLNHKLVELIGYGDEIASGPDANAAFKQPANAGYVPPGMSATPTVSTPAPAQGTPPVPNMVPQTTPPVPNMTPQGTPPVPNMGAPAPTVNTPGVTPAPDFLNAPQAGVPGTPPAPVAQPPVPAQTTPQMTASAGGCTYQQMLDAGWTHETMLAAGHIVA